ncbi:MAG: hypothetical protein JXQ75_07145 [Phycisphaerae bacterium]|nr:hypothetical protein [Phycisphaerae bacterium]
MVRREFTLDRLTRSVLLVITVLLTVIAIELWAGRPSMLPTAQAQVPDSGLQRNQMIDEAHRTNRLLEEILQHLRAKAIKVEIMDTDKADGSRGRGGKSPP